jgi:protein involved in polysaccharide export with SLBB domain
MNKRLLMGVFLFLLIISQSFANDPDEKIYPGNLLSFSLYGNNALTKDFRINPKGFISIPELGLIDCKDQTVSSLQKLIINKLAVFYKNATGLTITKKTNEIYIYVMGVVRRPNYYLVYFDSTIEMAIEKAGGLSEGAQMNLVQLRHNGKTTVIDYKKYLDTGDTSLLPKLAPMDELFVPSAASLGNIKINNQYIGYTPNNSNYNKKIDYIKSIKIFGEVNKPGAYSYNPKHTAIDYLMRAGGTTRFAANDQIKVIDNTKSVVFNLKKYLENAKPTDLPNIILGATIFVPQLAEAVKEKTSTFYVMGQVQKPGAYELSKNTNFMDALATAGGPDHYAESRKIRLIRQNGVVEYFDMQAFVDAKNPVKIPEIRAGDVIYIPIKTDLNEKSWLSINPNRAVKIIGGVVRPGRYEWSDEMSLLDLLAHAGGPTKDGDIASIRIISNELGSKTVHSTKFNLTSFLEKGGDVSSIPVIKAGYTVEIPEVHETACDNKVSWTKLEAKSTIYVFGEVQKPGRYNFNDQLNFLDILSAADGPTEKADMHDIHLIDRQGIYPQVVHINLSLYFETGDPELIPKVLPGDAIYIPQKNKDFTEVNSKHVIKILGEIAKPGSYRYTSDMTILDLLSAAGGPTSQAWVKKILIVNIGPKLETKSSTFDLMKFSRTGDLKMLPTLREGDVVYVPNNEEDDKKRLAELLQNLANVALIVSSAGTLKR